MTEETKVETESGTPAWMLGTGVDTDMTGESQPGSGASLRFWLPKGSERRIIFLTEGNAAPAIWEHQVKLGGKWTNWFTCLAPLGVPCELCNWADSHDGQFRRYKGLFFSVIDTHPFTDKKGVTRKDLKKLMCCKQDTTELLKRAYLKRLEADQGLRGAMYDAYRTNSDKSAAVGENFEFIKMIDIASLADSKELDYGDLLKPQPSKVKSAIERLNREHGAAPATVARPEGTESKVTY